MLKQEIDQFQEDGSIPIPTLHVKARNLTVTPCHLKEIRAFVEKHHYSKNVNGVKTSYCFKIEHQGTLIGGVIFGAMSTTAWKKFADNEQKVMELRRLVILDIAGKNSESRAIGYCLRYIRKESPRTEIIVSYADPYYNHEGTIYRASNFEYIGLSGKDKGFKDITTGKTYHSRALRTKYKGDYKPFVKKLREKLQTGNLIPITLPPMHCYIYKFKM